MKRTVKIISTMLLVLMLVVTVAGTVYAAPDIEATLNKIENPTQNIDDTKITNIGGNIVNIVQVVGIVVAVIIILIIGIKYMTKSAEGKAEYKSTMIPYLVGAVLIFAGTSIVKVVYSLAQQVKA